MAILVTVLAVVLALVVVLLAGLLRSHAEILRALHDLGVDLDPDAPSSGVRSPAAFDVPRPRAEPRPARDLVGTTPRGDAASIAVRDVDHGSLLAFLTTGCSTCAEFWTAFSAGERLRVPGGARLVVVTKGPEGESVARVAKFSTGAVPVVMSSQAWHDYDVPTAPYFVYVDGDSSSVVGEGAAGTWEHVASMMTQALADAGFDARRPRRGRRAESGRERAADVDRALLAAGIEPGDPSLYPRRGEDLHAHAPAPEAAP